MHYAYDVLVLTTHTVTNHLEVPVKLAAGIIKHVSIIFPPGCSRLVRCTFWDNANQLLPTNPEAYYSEDGYSVEASCYIPTWVHGNEFTILAWNVGTNYQHLIHFLLDVQGVDEPDLAQSIKDLNYLMDSLVTALKGLW